MTAVGGFAIGDSSRKLVQGPASEKPAQGGRTLGFAARERETASAATALGRIGEPSGLSAIQDELAEIKPEVDLIAAPPPVERAVKRAVHTAALTACSAVLASNDNPPEVAAGWMPPHDEGYVRQCYQRIMDLKGVSTATRTDTTTGIHEVLEDMAELAQKKGCSYAAMVDSLLMLHWTRKKEGTGTSYDDFMKEHVETIKILVKAWVKNKSFDGQRKIKILDASCGTGKVLEAFLEALPRRMHSRIRLVANDVSAASLNACKETLKRFDRQHGGKVHIGYTRCDITQELPPGKFDVVMLSQTLPFICDEKALRAQRLGMALPSESRHITAKKRALQSLTRRVKQGKGEFLLIDEEPMILSGVPDDFEGIVEDTLFREIFRPIDRAKLINEVMKNENMPEARFLGHLESFIDREHTMYLVASTQTPTHHMKQEKDKGAEKGDAAEGGQVPEDERLIIRRMVDIHPLLIGRLQEFDTNTPIRYRPIGVNHGQTLYIDREYYGEHIAGRNGYWHKNGSYNLVILSGLMHELGAEDYRSLIDKLKRSKKAEAGAALLFIDEYPAPAGKATAVGNTAARSAVMKFDDHEFCASVRIGNKYGYLYVIRDLDAAPIGEGAGI